MTEICHTPMACAECINELDNTIAISVETLVDRGISEKTNKDVNFNGIRIRMVGPFSEVEHVITVKEAQCLYELLHGFVKSDQQGEM